MRDDVRWVRETKSRVREVVRWVGEGGRWVKASVYGVFGFGRWEGVRGGQPPTGDGGVGIGLMAIMVGWVRDYWDKRDK